MQVDEGEEFTLSDLGIGLSDPGFDNPLNPLPGGELQETFTGLMIDWGDGTSAVPVSIDNVNDRVSGSEGVLTTAVFTHSASCLCRQWHLHGNRHVSPMMMVVQQSACSRLLSTT